MEQQSTKIDAYAVAAFEFAAVGLACLDSKGRFLFANESLRNLLGFSTQQFQSLTFEEIVHPKSQVLFRNALEELVSDKTSVELIELNCFDHAGRNCWLNIKLSTTADKQQLIAVIESAIHSESAIENPRISRKLFEAIAESIPTTVWLSDISGKKIYFVNQAFLDTWEISREDALSSTADDLMDRIHPDDRKHIHEFNKEIVNDRWSTNIRIITSDKKMHYLESKGTVLRDHNNKAQYFLGTHHDVTDSVVRAHKLETLNQQLQESYEEVTRLNQFDQLTKCYNRTAALVYVSDAFYQYRRYEIPSSVIYIDLNKFKEVNDKYGHYAGDLVLKRFVGYMQERIRQTDTLGRLGGDEFILLLPGTNKENSLLFLKKEAQEFATQIDDELEIILSYSAGVQECDFSFASVDEWIDAADKLMYAEKELLKS